MKEHRVAVEDVTTCCVEISIKEGTRRDVPCRVALVHAGRQVGAGQRSTMFRAVTHAALNVGSPVDLTTATTTCNINLFVLTLVFNSHSRSIQFHLWLIFIPLLIDYWESWYDFSCDFLTVFYFFFNYYYHWFFLMVGIIEPLILSCKVWIFWFLNGGG